MISGQLPYRNTKSYIVYVGSVKLFFSYETLITYSAPGERYRRSNSWGPTTGKHFNEMGCGGFDLTDNLDTLAMAAIQRQALESVKNRMTR